MTGRVVEAGTDKPIVSAPRDECGTPGALMAGFVHYYPLAEQRLLRGTPTGLAFEDGRTTRTTTGLIGGDGRFRLVVPPGPGVLVVTAAPGLAMFAAMMPAWAEVEQDRPMHHLFPYERLKGRTPDDGAPRSAGAMTLPGFAGPISLETCHVYRVIDPSAAASKMTVDFAIRVAPSRVLRFVDPDGQPVRDVTVQGLLGPNLPSAIVTVSEAEATGLDPDRPREVLVISNDGRFFARSPVPVEPKEPLTIRLEPVGSVSGRLVDDAGLPLANHQVIFSYSSDISERDIAPRGRIPRPTGQVVTEADGRFRLVGLVPGLRVSVSFQEPSRPGFVGHLGTYQPAAGRDLTFRSGRGPRPRRPRPARASAP